MTILAAGVIWNKIFAIKIVGAHYYGQPGRVVIVREDWRGNLSMEFRDAPELNSP